jgi:HEPN domain-containing protein
MAAFDLNKTIKYWLDGAQYDLETARSLLQTKRFPYALFFAHLALEKVLKALVVKNTQEHAPYTHSLPFLASKLGIEIPEQTLDRFAEYMEFHLEARYPDEKKDFYKKCTEEFSVGKFKEMEEIYQWLIQQLGTSSTDL